MLSGPIMLMRAQAEILHSRNRDTVEEIIDDNADEQDKEIALLLVIFIPIIFASIVYFIVKAL